MTLCLSLLVRGGIGGGIVLHFDISITRSGLLRFLVIGKDLVDFVALIRAVYLRYALSLLEHLLCDASVLIEDRLGDPLVQGEVLWLYLPEAEYGEDWLNDGVGRLQLEDCPGVTLAESLYLGGCSSQVIPWVLQLRLVQVVHSFNLTDQPILPTLDENSLRCGAYLSKSMIRSDMARMLSEEKVVCSKGIKFSSPPSATRSSCGKSC